MGSVANAGWFNMNKIGNTLHGTLEGMFERKDDLRPEKVSNFFQIKISQPCEVRMGKGQAARLVEAKARTAPTLGLSLLHVATRWAISRKRAVQSVTAAASIRTEFRR